MTDRIAAMQDFKLYRELHWEGGFEDYLGIVRENAAGHAQRVPAPLRDDHQLRDRGVHRQQKKLTRYNFFKDEQSTGSNAIYGLTFRSCGSVHVLKAAAEGYGPERRVILLHGPVRLIEEHHRPASEAGSGAILALAGRGALHVRVGGSVGHGHREQRSGSVLPAR